MRILRNNNIPDLGRHDVVCADYGQTNLKMGLVRIDGQDLTLSRSYLFFSNEINPHSSSSSVPAIAKKICDENKINYLNLSIASSETIYYKEGGKHSNYMKWGFSSNQNSLHDMTVLFHDFNKFAFHNDAVAMSLTSLFFTDKFPVLVMTLGTGIGSAFISKQDNQLFVQPLESFKEIHWFDYGMRCNVHDFFGINVFPKSGPTEDSRTLNKKAVSLLRYYSSELQYQHNLQAKSILLAGGNVRYLSRGLLEGEFPNKLIYLQSDVHLGLYGAALAWSILPYSRISVPCYL